MAQELVESILTKTQGIVQCASSLNSPEHWQRCYKKRQTDATHPLPSAPGYDQTVNFYFIDQGSKYEYLCDLGY